MDRQAQPDIAKSEQRVLNNSFDEKFKVLAVESLVYNPTSDTLERHQTGFGAGADITTVINGDVITQTDGVRTYTVTINGDTITEEWT